MPFDGEESRAAQRVDFVGPAVVKAQGRDVSCTIVNLSSAGMLLIPAASARPGLQMRVVFEVRGLGRLDLEAVLARETQLLDLGGAVMNPDPDEPAPAEPEFR